MASSMVIGPPNCHDRWTPIITNSTEDRPHTTGVPPMLSPARGTVGHHRSYSDVYNSSSQLRLPPIRNFLEGVVRPNYDFPPVHHSSTSKVPMHNGHHNPQTTFSTSIHHSGWPSAETLRQGMHHGPYPPLPERTEVEHYSSEHMHGQPVESVLPQSSHRDCRSNSSYSVTASSCEAISPITPKTNKNLIREDVIAGRPCFIYDDGSVCQKVINGDTVNPKWGTTKAGKPRKRLGQACNTCREKKIKCDPSYPKCNQCQRFGRECKFEATSRSGQKSPKQRGSRNLPNKVQSPDDTTRLRRPSAALTDSSDRSDSGNTTTSRTTDIDEEHTTYAMGEVNLETLEASAPIKRPRLTEAVLFPESSMAVSNSEYASSIDGKHSALRALFSRDVDPFAANRKMTEIYLDAYFAYINTAALGLMPQRQFMQWVQQEDYKSETSKLVIYCMLAVGCKFANTPDRASHERVFTEIALEGVTQAVGQFSVQLIHARLIFSLHEFQVGNEQRAWDLGGAAMRAACAMELNTEAGVAEACHAQHSVYGLKQDMLMECLRRTFWIIFIMDRYAVASLGYATTFNRADLFLRLPCTEAAYNSGHIPELPIFDGEEGIAPCTSNGLYPRLGPLAYLAQIASLSCDVHILATRAKHQGSAHRGERYARMRSKLERQLSIWDQEYTAYLSTGDSTTNRGSRNGTPKFGGLHVMYHHACMTLHRYIHHSTLTIGQIAHHANEAYRHACRTLEIAQQLVSKGYRDIGDYYVAATSALSGYAILSAIDILTAAGLSSDLLENDGRLMRLMMKGGVPLLDTLAEHWASAERQREIVSTRTKILFSSLQNGVSEGKVAFLVREPMSHSFSSDDDLIYGVDRVQYLELMGWSSHVRDRSDFVEVSVL